MPSIRQFWAGKPVFSETVRVEYDPAKVSLDHLLLAYFYVIDPTVLNKQGNDTGTQYQTGIYYTNTQAQAVVERIVELERGRHKGICSRSRTTEKLLSGRRISSELS